MKKILSFLLAATLIAAIFVLPSAAADNINYGITVEELEEKASRPKIDGVIGRKEYGDAIHTYSESKEQFTHDDDHDDYNNWDFDFYMTWDEDKLYMAWEVQTEVHHGLEEGTYESDGTKTADTWPDGDPTSMLGHMWWNSCIQFIITPGAPEKGVSAYTNNYLEAGIALLGDGTQARVIWSTPTGFETSDININDWDAAIVRDDEANTTTYEVAIPWEYTTVNAKGDTAQFGLSYAVAAQENYNTKKGMIEWQDGLLGSKQPDNAAVITLKGHTDKVIINELTEGQVPDEYKTSIKLTFKGYNAAMASESSGIYTDLTKDLIADYSLGYSYLMLLKPIEGTSYEVVETVQNNNGANALTSTLEEGMLIAAFHSDGTEGAIGAELKNLATSVAVGSKVELFGVDLAEGKFTYTNPMIYVTELVEAPVGGGDDTSDDTSSESSDVVSEEVSDEESDEESVETSTSTSTNTSTGDTTDDGEDEGLGVWLWVIIGAVVVVVAVVVVIVLKKKKQ